MSNLPRLGEIVNPQQQNDSQTTTSGPSRPEVDRPSGKPSFVMSPYIVLSRLVREKKIKREHVLVMMGIANWCHRQPSGQWTVSFPSEATLAYECGCSEKTVQRAVKSMQKNGLATVYAARMKDGEYAHNVYDCTPWFRLCGTLAREHNIDTVRQHLNKEGRWVRGLERFDAAGNVVQWADFDKNQSGGRTPVSGTLFENLAGVYSETAPQQPGTGGHGCPANLTAFAVEIVNENKSNSRPRLKSLGDDLTGAEQVVFVALKDLAYGAHKAKHDIKKFGTNYVQRLIDYVKCQENVREVPRLINKLMGSNIDELYRPKSGGKKSAPAPAVPRPAPATASHQTPAPQPATPTKTSLEKTAECRAEILRHTQAQISRAVGNVRLELLNSRSESGTATAKKFSIEEAGSVNALIENMKHQNLAAVLHELSVIKNKEKARAEMEEQENFGGFSDSDCPPDEDFDE